MKNFKRPIVCLSDGDKLEKNHIIHLSMGKGRLHPGPLALGRTSREDDGSSVRDVVLQVLGDRHAMDQSPRRWKTLIGPNLKMECHGNKKETRFDSNTQTKKNTGSFGLDDSS